MKRTPKEIKQQTEEWLNERWNIANMDLPPAQKGVNMTYYDGALKAVELLGYEWIRHEDGTHTILKVK